MTPTTDAYTPALKRATSTVQRLRGWVGKDDSRQTELADALVALTAIRLRGHLFVEAAADAQEALSLAAKLIASHGPLGPYTPPEAAGRCVSAAVNLCVVQSAAGSDDAAAATLATATQLLDALAAQGVRPTLDPEVAVWALIVASRLALGEGDVARANAAADAALAWQAQRGPDRFQPVDVLLVVSDARWAAGRPDDALTAAWQARRAWADLIAPIKSLGRRASPARIARMTQPASALLSILADRLVLTKDIDTAIEIRRELIELLLDTADVREPLGDAEYAQASADLAADLRSAGRDVEADTLLADDHVASLPRRELRVPGEPLAWMPWPTTDAFAPRRVAEPHAEMPPPHDVTDTTDPVQDARDALASAKASNDQRAALVAANAVVTALRPHTDRTDELIAALQELATVQRASGDWWGSRKPAKEAKELAKRWRGKEYT